MNPTDNPQPTQAQPAAQAQPETQAQPAAEAQQPAPTSEAPAQQQTTYPIPDGTYSVGVEDVFAPAKIETQPLSDTAVQEIETVGTEIENAREAGTIEQPATQTSIIKDLDEIDRIFAEGEGQGEPVIIDEPTDPGLDHPNIAHGADGKPIWKK